MLFDKDGRLVTFHLNTILKLKHATNFFVFQLKNGFGDLSAAATTSE